MPNTQIQLMRKATNQTNSIYCFLVLINCLSKVMNVFAIDIIASICADTTTSSCELYYHIPEALNALSSELKSTSREEKEALATGRRLCNKHKGSPAKIYGKYGALVMEFIIAHKMFGCNTTALDSAIQSAYDIIESHINAPKISVVTDMRHKISDAVMSSVDNVSPPPDLFARYDPILRDFGDMCAEVAAKLRDRYYAFDRKPLAPFVPFVIIPPAEPDTQPQADISNAAAVISPPAEPDAQAEIYNAAVDIRDRWLAFYNKLIQYNVDTQHNEIEDEWEKFKQHEAYWRRFPSCSDSELMGEIIKMENDTRDLYSKSVKIFNKSVDALNQYRHMMYERVSMWSNDINTTHI